jgi:nucleotide-binding universal stress UspA family protein
LTEPLRFKTIVVPTDFSASADRALAFARELALAAGPAHLILVHAYFVPVEMEALAVQLHEPILEQISERASADLERLLVELQDAGLSAEFYVGRGSPERVIREIAAEKGASLIVMGTHGRTGLRHVVLGSVAERVVRTAPCPVITVREERS